MFTQYKRRVTQRSVIAYRVRAEAPPTGCDSSDAFCHRSIRCLKVSIHSKKRYMGLLPDKQKMWVANAPRMTGTFSLPPTSKETASYRSRHASGYVRHERVVMHVGIADPRWRENVPGIPGAYATRNFAYLVSGPCRVHLCDIQNNCRPIYIGNCSICYAWRLSKAFVLIYPSDQYENPRNENDRYVNIQECVFTNTWPFVFVPKRGDLLLNAHIISIA